MSNSVVSVEVKKKEFNELTKDVHSKSVTVKSLLSQDEFSKLVTNLSGFSQNDTAKILHKVNKSFCEFIDYYQTLRYSKTNTASATDMLNLVVDSLERCNVLTQDPTHPNGVTKIKSINNQYHKYLGDHRLSILFREKVDVDYNVNLSDKSKLIGIAQGTNVPFDMFIALRYAEKVMQCKERDIKFELTLTEFSTLYKKKSCFYSGIELSLSGDHSATIDRLDSTTGYVKGNCVICSSKVNQIKNILLESSDLTMGMTANQIKRMFSKFIEVM